MVTNPCSCWPNTRPRAGYQACSDRPRRGICRGARSAAALPPFRDAAGTSPTRAATRPSSPRGHHGFAGTSRADGAGNPAASQGGLGHGRWQAGADRHRNHQAIRAPRRSRALHSSPRTLAGRWRRTAGTTPSTRPGRGRATAATARPPEIAGPRRQSGRRRRASGLRVGVLARGVHCSAASLAVRGRVVQAGGLRLTHRGLVGAFAFLVAGQRLR